MDRIPDPIEQFKADLYDALVVYEALGKISQEQLAELTTAFDTFRQRAKELGLTYKSEYQAARSKMLEAKEAESSGN